MINVLIADIDEKGEIENYLKRHAIDIINIVGSTDNGATAIELLNKNNIDVVILNPILKMVDGFAVANYLNREKFFSIKAIVVTDFYNSSLIKRFNDNNVIHNIIIKPIDTDYFLKAIEDAYAFRNKRITDTLIHTKSKISNTEILPILLEELGVKSNLKGFKYIEASIEFVISNYDTKLYMTKDVYPYIAMKFDTSVANIERCLRHCISIAHKENLQLYEELFANCKPKVSEFIYTVANRLANNTNSETQQ